MRFPEELKGVGCVCPIDGQEEMGRWVLNPWRCFENFVLQIHLCWGGSEKHLAAPWLSKRHILPFFLKIKHDGFENYVQNSSLL